MKNKPQNIIISRTDNLGDVVLTLPIAGILKEHFPECKITFIGKQYTRPVIENCKFIDTFWDRDQLPEISNNETIISPEGIIFVFPDKQVAKWAKRQNIKLRIGTSHRLFHWFTCNKLVNFSRKKSSLHEAELNQKLLSPLGIESLIIKENIHRYFGFKNTQLKSQGDTKKKIIFHPKSKGSAREWPLKNYLQLAEELHPDLYEILITGTEAEGSLIKSQEPDIFKLKNVKDLTGKLSLSELINTIGTADGLIACSTGPLHIASAFGKPVCGIYPPIKPMHPGRWAPLGVNATVLVLDKECSDCRVSQDCSCIRSIEVGKVKSVIESWFEK